MRRKEVSEVSIPVVAAAVVNSILVDRDSNRLEVRSSILFYFLESLQFDCYSHVDSRCDYFVLMVSVTL